jgi:hypothetical protein
MSLEEPLRALSRRADLLPEARRGLGRRRTGRTARGGAGRGAGWRTDGAVRRGGWELRFVQRWAPMEWAGTLA